jgi:glutaredoxin
MATADRLLVLAAIVVAVAIVSVVARVLLRRRHALIRLELADIAGADGDPVTVVFTSPRCHGCRQWIAALEAGGVAPHTIDLAEHPQAANRYKISATPRVAVVRPGDGSVLREFDHYSPRAHDLEAIWKLTRTSRDNHADGRL